MFPFGCVPIDKESLRFMAAWSLLKENENDALDYIESVRRAEHERLRNNLTDEKKRLEAYARVDEELEKKRAVEKAKFNNRRRLLLRRAAGPFAKVVEG